MSWQTLVKDIHKGVNMSKEHGDLRRSRDLGLVTRPGTALTKKGLDWVEGRITIERRGNTQGMDVSSTWLASLPTGLRLDSTPTPAQCAAMDEMSDFGMRMMSPERRTT